MMFLYNLSRFFKRYEVPDMAELKEALLDENDDLWVKFRHDHIADVTRYDNRELIYVIIIRLKKKNVRFFFYRIMTDDLKNLMDRNHIAPEVQDSASSLREISFVMKSIPQYRKQLITHCTHLNLLQVCTANYKDNLNRLYKVEQELALGKDSTGAVIEDHMKDIAPILSDKTVSNYDKIRVIILYLMSKNGISKESFNKIIKTAQLSAADKRAIVNLNLLGFNIILNVSGIHTISYTNS